MTRLPTLIMEIPQVVAVSRRQLETSTSEHGCWETCLVTKARLVRVVVFRPTKCGPLVFSRIKLYYFIEILGMTWRGIIHWRQQGTAISFLPRCRHDVQDREQPSACTWPEHKPTMTGWGDEKSKQTWRNSKVRLAKTGSAVGHDTIHGLKFEAIGGHRGLQTDCLAMIVFN